MLSVLIINVVKLTVMFSLLYCNVVMLSDMFFIVGSVSIHNVVKLTVVILNVIMLNVVAPQNNPRQNANNPNPTKHVQSDSALSDTRQTPRLRLGIETWSSKNLLDFPNGIARFSDFHIIKRPPPRRY
jgi:hypothetical protein